LKEGFEVTDYVIPKRAWWNLALATLAFAVNFWAWALLSPLAPKYQEQMGLSAVQTSLLIAVPVIVGSLGRIPIGALTDRHGGRLMFTIVSFTTIVPVLFLAYATNYWAVVAGGFVLGLGGTTFAIGVPHVNAWFPPKRRGFALGIFGVGTGGTAIAALATPRITEYLSRQAAFFVVAAALVLVGILCMFTMRSAPSWQKSEARMSDKLKAAMSHQSTWELAALYAVTFGGYVALSNYLPTYLKIDYGLSVADASAKMAGFVVLAVIARPVGGTLADKFGGARVLMGSLSLIGLFAVLAAFHGSLIPVATIAFFGLAMGVGAGAGAVFALVSQTVPTARVGAVTGFVGAMGGLGGFVPPLLMGFISQATASYAIGFMLLSDVAFAALAFTWVKLHKRPKEQEA
jgi:NNP family nitrate/nitrite transporter-like MFS transporter